MVDYKKQGKKNKAAGKAFEDRVYADLEKKEWIVSRFMKNVELTDCGIGCETIRGIKLIPAKPSIRMISGRGPMLVSTWTGFVDYICFHKLSGNEILENLKNDN